MSEKCKNAKYGVTSLCIISFISIIKEGFLKFLVEYFLKIENINVIVIFIIIVMCCQSRITYHASRNQGGYFHESSCR